MGEFIARQKEIAQIRQTVSRENSTITVIYGRRRVGKSQLIREALQGKKVYFFEGLENQEKSKQIFNFLTQLSFQTHKEFVKKEIGHWEEAFLELVDLCRNQSVTLVFDEFQWMANYRSEIVSDFKMVWEQYLSRSGKIHIILCGSIASFMIKKVLRSQALYGRTDLEIHLQPFQLFETKEMFPQKSQEEILQAHMLVGGIPKYLELLSEQDSVYRAIQNLAFAPNGYFIGEYDRIFVSHFGKNQDFEKIIEALNSHPYGLNRSDISEFVGIPPGGGLSQQLYDLEMAGFIQSYVPFDKNKNSRQVLYCLKDPYFRFYFSFIRPNLKKIEGGLEDIFYRLAQTTIYSSWLGRAFEHLCFDHARKISQILGFSGIDYSFGPYFQAGKKTKKGMQIDLIFDRADHVLSVCEMKYTTTPPGKDLILSMEKKLTLIQAKTKKTIHKVLVTKTAPSQDLVNSGYFYKIILAEQLMG